MSIFSRRRLLKISRRQDSFGYLGNIWYVHSCLKRRRSPRIHVGRARKGKHSTARHARQSPIVVVSVSLPSWSPLTLVMQRKYCHNESKRLCLLFLLESEKGRSWQQRSYVLVSKCHYHNQLLKIKSRRNDRKSLKGPKQNLRVAQNLRELSFVSFVEESGVEVTAHRRTSVHLP